MVDKKTYLSKVKNSNSKTRSRTKSKSSKSNKSNKSNKSSKSSKSNNTRRHTKTKNSLHIEKRWCTKTTRYME